MPFVRCALATSMLLAACGSNPCPAQPEAGARFVSPENAALAVTWDDSRYDPLQNCLRTDGFIIEGVTGFSPEELDRFFEEHVELPDRLRSASIGPSGPDIRLTFSLFDPAYVAGYQFAVNLDGDRIVVQIPLAD